MTNEPELSVQDEFLKDIEPDEKDSVLDAPLEEAKEVVEEEAAEDVGLKIKNRREKRLAQKYQAERESGIALAARLQAITESQKLASDVEADYLKKVERIYGTDSPEAKTATDLLKEALTSLKDSAKKEALEEIESRRTSESQAVKQEEQKLDEILESLEDEHGIDLTEGPDRKGFLTLLEKLSPKDRDGNIIEYADPETTLEVYLSRKEKAPTRAKELANRSMTRSGSSQPSKLEETTLERFLKENDII